MNETILKLQPTVQAWADITIKDWIRKIDQLGIEGDHLARSFASHVQWAAAGDQQKISFAFDYVGKFTDMGVGNGVSLATRDALISAGFTKRRQKQWYTGTFYKQVARLRHLLAERTGEHIQFALIRNLTEEKIISNI